MNTVGYNPSESAAEKLTQLEIALDALCKVAKRDIFVAYPHDNDAIAPYLIEEIKKTVELL
ncbi:MAG: hypothetical protein CME70_17790 [Halobacteriovorax sp.]|nr:hypothetical protein [Halobacteriovorax sp.]|tara:strand:+ start:17716 stop:17898 length:183 start_codon:yes stop_codon:yes gene_type:complete